MILRHCLAVAALLCCCYSYSEEIRGTTSNAITNNVGAGIVWQPQNVLPPQAGLVVNGLIYRYTAVKNQQDPMSVTVQNENAIDGGYVFQKKDDWSGLNGTTITHAQPINNVAREYWGTGSIVVEGQGQVVNPYVIYNYRFDPCYDPQVSPSCPGYKAPVDNNVDYSLTTINLDDVPKFDNISDDYNDEDSNRENKDKKSSKKDGKKSNTSKNTLLTEDALNMANLMERLNNMENFKSYFFTLPDNVMNDVLTLKDSNLPDNKRGKRVSQAQEILHQQMVDMQYNKK